MNIIFMSSTVDVSFYIGRDSFAEIHFIFFAIRLSRGKNKKHKGKKLSLKFLFKNYPYLKSAFDRHLSVSRVSLIEYIPSGVPEMGEYFSHHIGKLLTLRSIESYLQAKSKDFCSIITPVTGEKNAVKIIFSFRLFQLFISLAFFPYYKIKSSIRRKEYV